MQCGCSKFVKFFHRDLKKEPYAMWSIYCNLAFAIIFSIILIGVCANGLKLNNLLDPSLNTAICQTEVSMEEIRKGQPGKEWAGTNSLLERIKNINI